MEKELQEKAAAQLVPSKREAGDGGETSSAEHRDRWGYCQCWGTLSTPVQHVLIVFSLPGTGGRLATAWRLRVDHHSQSRTRDRSE